MITKMIFSRNSLRIVKSITLKRKYSSDKLCQEVAIPVPWGEIRGKWWGRTDIRPILTIHGWQDNSGSFDRLLPLLKNNSFLAIDLPGHGYSSRIPSGMPYNMHSYLLTVEYVKAYFQWPKLSLIGHSMGCLINYHYAILYPEIVDLFLNLDGVIMWDMDRVPPMAAFIDSFTKFQEFASSNHEPPCYELEQMRLMIHKPHNESISLKYADLILKRNIAASKHHPGKYYFTRDPRLKFNDYFTISTKELKMKSENIIFPTLIVKFTQSPYGSDTSLYDGLLNILPKYNPNAEFHIVQGTHHGHLNNPEELAKVIQQFIDKHSEAKNCSHIL